MRQSLQLTPARPTGSIRISRAEAQVLFIANPTASPIAIRATGPDIPAISNADYLCPANSFLTIPATGSEFGFAMTAPLSVVSSPSANLATTATIVALSDEEDIPTFGAAQFQNTAQAILTTNWQAFGGAITYGPFDLLAWGGAIVAVRNQGATNFDVQLVANDVAGPVTIGSFTIGPLQTGIIQVPKTSRLLSVSIAPTGVTSGLISIVATVGEITQLSISPSNIGPTDLLSTTVRFYAFTGGAGVWTNLAAGLNGIHAGRNLYLARLFFHLSVASTLQVALGNNVGPLVTFFILAVQASAPAYGDFTAPASSGMYIDVSLYNTLWAQVNPGATAAINAIYV